ncbi:MAG: ArsR/SmtB family transcription factor [Candidatus Acetothermia bacterium]
MDLEDVENLLGTLANQTRLRLLKIMIKYDKEICVCEFEDALNLPQYSVSRHLNKLKERGLVESRREGTWAYYSLSSELDLGRRKLIKWLDDHIDEKTLREDRKRMEERLSLRKNGKCVAGREEESDCK